MMRMASGRSRGGSGGPSFECESFLGAFRGDQTCWHACPASPCHPEWTEGVCGVIEKTEGLECGVFRALQPSEEM
jgi:Zn-finger protein